MSQTKYTNEDIGRIGTEIYRRQIRPQVMPQHKGKFLILDIISSDYEIDADDTIDLQEMIWKIRTGFHEQTGVSRKKRYADHAIGGYTREYQNTAQSRHRQRSLPPSSARLST